MQTEWSLRSGRADLNVETAGSDTPPSLCPRNGSSVSGRSRGSASSRQRSMARKRHFLSHLYIKINILPRQARDKHRENSKKSAVFPGMVRRIERVRSYKEEQVRRMEAGLKDRCAAETTVLFFQSCPLFLPDANALLVLRPPWPIGRGPNEASNNTREKRLRTTNEAPFSVCRFFPAGARR
jgi:hypothetical protein